MKVLVYEPKFVGHHLGFAASAAEAVHELGCEVVFTIPERARDTPQAEINLQGIDPAIEVVHGFDLSGEYKKKASAIPETDALAEMVATHRPDHVIAPSADFILAGLLKRSGLRRELGRIGADFVLHNVQQAYSGLGKRARVLGLLDQLSVTLAHPIQLHTVDPFVTSSKAAWPAGLFGNPIHPLPLIIDHGEARPTKKAAREALGFPEEARMLGSIGGLSPRKGTELLIESFLRADPPEGVVLALFGILSPPARELLAAHQPWLDAGRIVVRDEYVTDSDFRNFVFSVDVFWAGYLWQIGLATTLLHAADAGCPSIASNKGCVEFLTREYGLGRVYPPTVDAMSSAILEFAGDPEWSVDEEGRRRLLEYHTSENFSRCLTRQLRQRMGVEGEPTP